MVNIAVLDDYQGVALTLANWKALPGDARVTSFRDHLDDQAAVIRRLRDFEVVCVMRERTPLPRTVLQQLPKLQLLVTTGGANASIDMNAATELGILVCSTGNFGNPTAELTWGIILGMLRSIPQEDHAVRAGKWQTSVGIGMQDKTLGIIGLGNLGSHVATIGKAFKMHILAWSQNLTAERARQFGATLVSKDELMSQSDIVTIHTRLSERTRGLIGARELALMKPTAYLVNTSRGPIVTEDAMVQALRERRIAGAGLDVFDQEPLRADHPLLSMNNVVLTPHLGYVTKETYGVFYRDTVEDIAAFLEGKPMRMINPQALENTKRRTMRP
ncbi:MAG: D-2-hydroxyacid dehydrogenase family protein [Dehalococcoidia bacterium]|nr:D-2-hydroxyacid dehydrogenase family protein [Dehalococcoidia bacterium]